MICLAVQLLAKPGHEKKIKDNFGKLTAESRKEPGCLMYLVHQSFEDPRKFLVYEQYGDTAALEFHRKSPHFREFATDGVYKWIESREAGLYVPLS